jgi:hypothetical protein
MYPIGSVTYAIAAYTLHAVRTRAERLWRLTRLAAPSVGAAVPPA